MLDIDDLLQTGRDGRGVVNILTADRLINSPALYATFLLWLLSELFEQLPEIGDPDRPRIVFFFDEAHLLFDDAPEALVDKIEQVVRLIRSKGVGVFFVTQSPSDIPEPVLRQLGNRIHHALRAYTPRETKAVKVLAENLRPNPGIDPARVVTELAVGEALVSLLDEKGTPTPVERAWMRAPGSRIGPIDPAQRETTRRGSVIGDHYRATVDRDSAYEKLKARAEQREPPPEPPAERPSPPAGRPRTVPPSGRPADSLNDLIFGSTGPRGGRRDGLVQAAAKSAARSVGSSIGRQILRGVLGSMFGGRR
jgi:DNA helicase HerA-like ATPase